MSDSPREIMIVRHPETVANVESRYMGTGDSPITERGQWQTHWLTQVVGAWAPMAVYASPLGRTLATAVAIAPPGTEVTVLPGFAEIDFGDAEGLTHSELHARGLSLDYASGGPIAPGGETERAFNERVQRAAGVLESGPSRSVVVTHGGVIRRLLTQWLELASEAGWRFAIPNASVAVVRCCSPTGVLLSLTPPPEMDAQAGGTVAGRS